MVDQYGRGKQSHFESLIFFLLIGSKVPSICQIRFSVQNQSQIKLLRSRDKKMFQKHPEQNCTNEVYTNNFLPSLV